MCLCRVTRSFLDERMNKNLFNVASSLYLAHRITVENYGNRNKLSPHCGRGKVRNDTVSGLENEGKGLKGAPGNIEQCSAMGGD